MRAYAHALHYITLRSIASDYTTLHYIASPHIARQHIAFAYAHGIHTYIAYIRAHTTKLQKKSMHTQTGITYILASQKYSMHVCMSACS